MPDSKNNTPRDSAMCIVQYLSICTKTSVHMFLLSKVGRFSAWIPGADCNLLAVLKSECAGDLQVNVY